MATKSIALFAGTLLILLSFGVARAETLLEKTLTVGKNSWSISVESVPSKPGGQGFCGTGEEVTLNIHSSASKKIAFSKLVESCLKSIELRDAEQGGESATSLLKAMDLDQNPIEIRWLSSQGKTEVVGCIDLKGATPLYFEKKSGLHGQCR